MKRISKLASKPLDSETNEEVLFLCFILSAIDLLAILPKSLDRALFLYIFIHDVRLSGVRASITIVHIRKFYKM